MYIDKRLYPYPVLNNNKLLSSFGKDFYFSLDYVQEERDDLYVLKGIAAETNSDFITQLVQEEKAEIICVVESAQTMFRKSYSISMTPQDIEISLFDIAGKVSINAFVITKEEVSNYTSAEFDSVYNGIEFTIPKHCIIAISDTFATRIDFNSDEDTNQDSAFLVLKDYDIEDNMVNIDYDQNKIILSLPPETWDIYENTKKLPATRNIYFSFMAVPALAEILSELHRNSDDIDQLRLEYVWFDSFAEQYAKKYGKELTQEDFDNMNYNVVAQEIMNQPVSKAINDVFSLLAVESGGVSDDD